MTGHGEKFGRKMEQAVIAMLTELGQVSRRLHEDTSAVAEAWRLAICDIKWQGLGPSVRWSKISLDISEVFL